MPTYTPETRQLYMNKSTHEKVRQYAQKHHLSISEVYLRLVSEVAFSTEPAEREDKVRAAVRIPDALWDIAQGRANAEKRRISALIEERIERL